MSDLIKKEDAIEVIKKWFEEIKLNPDILIDSIVSLPSAERPQGEWIHDYHFGLALPEHKCSVCGEWEYSDTESNYCPNCGARMKGADDDMY